MILKKVFTYENLLLFVIGVIAIIVYFYKLGEIPNGFYIDESLPGFNALSILRTGKDEYGKTMPIVFRFYGSFNPPLYTYLTVPLVFLFGLNVFSVRFLSALSGFLSAFVIYFFLKESKFLKNKFSKYSSLLLLTICPWLILHSRVGYEVSLAFLFFSLGVLFLWKSLVNAKFVIPAFIFLNISTYTAYSERFISPLVIVAWLILFGIDLPRKIYRTKFLTAVIVTLILQLPHIYLMTTPAFLPKSNLLSTSIISEQANKIFLPWVLSYPLAFVREVFSQYATYFSPRSLFFLPDPDLQRSIPELSVFYFWMVIPYVVGVYVLLIKRRTNFVKFIIILLLITPIPASLTRDPFSTHRALPLLLPMIVVISLGIDKIFESIPSYISFFSFLGLSLLSILLLWRSYFVLMPNERARVWGYGIRELAGVIEDNEAEKFVIDQSRMKPLYMQLAFFMDYPPSEFHKITSQRVEKSYYEEVSFNSNYSFSNLETRNIIWEKDVYEDKIIVGDELAISDDQADEHYLTKAFEINDPLGIPVFIGYKTNPLKKCESENFKNESCKKNL